VRDQRSSPGSPPAAASQPGAGGPLIQIEGVHKRYGPTRALQGADVTLSSGEVVAIVGHNGAGKSTLMRVICGLTVPDEGRILVHGADVTGDHSLAAARSAGIRIVFQELSLCAVLRAYENVLITHPQIRGLGWRRRAAVTISTQLDEIFPGHGIAPRMLVSSLSLAQRQMLEIARAAAPVGETVRMLILDEPTSALGARASSQLFEWLAGRRGEGLAAILISHRLREVLEHSDRTVVMRDGLVAGDGSSADLDRGAIVEMMGQAHTGSALEARVRVAAGERPQPVLEVDGLNGDVLRDVVLRVGEGEIVGLAGLDGQGQRELLFELWRQRHGRRRNVRTHGRMAFVAGDRQQSGLFRLWPLVRNISVGSLAAVQRAGLVNGETERRLVSEWIKRLEIRGGPGDPVTGLSGGTQQKALIARALASDARLLLFDDPFRGVDVGTKRQVYALVHEAAAQGRSFLWFTTENDELEECDRVYVLRQGHVVDELHGEEIREDRVIASSFAEVGDGERTA